MSEKASRTNEPEQEKRTLPQALQELGFLIGQAREALLIPGMLCEDKDVRQTGTVYDELVIHIDTVRSLQKEMEEIVKGIEQVRDQII